MNTTKLMQYGERLGIEDSKLNRGYLELAFRALILKEHFPNIRFRNVSIVKLSKRGNHSNMEVDLSPFLAMIGNYYEANLPQVYTQLKEKGLLDVSNYLGTKAAVMTALPGALQFAPLEEQVQHVKAKLEMIYLRNDERQIKADPELSRQVKVYTEALLELKKIPGANLDADIEDIPAATGQLKNLSDIANPKVQVLHREILKARHNANKRIQELVDEHDKLALEVVAEATNKPLKVLRKLAAASFITGLFTMNPFIIVSTIGFNVLLRRLDTNTRDTYGFMWRKSEEPGRTGYFMNTTDFHNGKALTPIQRKYRDFYRDKMRQVYSQVMSEQVAEYESGFSLSRGEASKKPLTLDNPMWDDFMPRIPATLSEIRENESFFTGFFGIQTSLRYNIRKHLGDYTKNTSNYDDRQILPVKYMAHTGDANVEAANHSFDPTRIFALFTGNLIHKQEFDHLYPMAKGLEHVLESSSLPDGSPAYPQLVKFLDAQIYNQILQTRKESKFTSRP